MLRRLSRLPNPKQRIVAISDAAMSCDGKNADNSAPRMPDGDHPRDADADLESDQADELTN